MRISSAWIQQLGVNAILNQQTLVSHTQLQLSTGQRMTTPADDPGAAVNSETLTASLKTTQQFQANVSLTLGRLQFEDSTLESTDALLIRLKELAVTSLNDTLTREDRIGLGDQAQQYLDELTGLANTKNASGDYIYSGYRTDTPPFVFDENRVPPSYVYQGDRNQRSLQIGEQRQIADGDPGYQVFEDVPSASGNLGLVAAGGRQSLLNSVYALALALKGEFRGSHGAMVGTANLAAGLDYSAGAQSFDLAADGNPSVTLTVPAQNYATPEALAAAINTVIGGTALNGMAVAQVRNGALEFVSTSTGPHSSVTVSNGTPGLLADAGFSDPETGTGATTSFHDAASAALNDIDAGLQKVLDIRASVGARLNALDEQQSLQSKFVIDTQSNLAKFQDLDYAEAISRFNQQQTVLQASQQAFAQVQKLSLFNYL